MSDLIGLIAIGFLLTMWAIVMLIRIRMTEKLAEAILDALRDIAFNLSDDGPLAEHLYMISERIEEITPEDELGRRFLRTLRRD